MTKLRAFLILSRPHFLLGGALMFALGSAGTRTMSWSGYVLGQTMVAAMQVTAHYVNEYADLEADRAVAGRTYFSGGSGVLVSGILRPQTALRAAWVSSGVGIVLAALVATRSVLGAALGLVALAVSWGYSMPPVRLLRTGWGELATSLVVAVVVPLISWSIQDSPLTAGLCWVMGVLLPMHMVMMLAFELPDLATDARAGKRVLAVRLGERRSWGLMGILLSSAAAVVGVGAATGGLAPEVARAALAGLPPALLLGWAVGHRRPAGTTTAAVLTLVFVAGGMTIALAV